MSGLGKILERERKRSGLWFKAFLGILGALCLANIFLRPHEPHFGYDGYFLFWPLFGLGIGVVMVGVVKLIIQPLIVRSENYYDDL